LIDKNEDTKFVEKEEMEQAMYEKFQKEQNEITDLMNHKYEELNSLKEQALKEKQEVEKQLNELKEENKANIGKSIKKDTDIKTLNQTNSAIKKAYEELKSK
jgi:hypothetical protein